MLIRAQYPWRSQNTTHMSLGNIDRTAVLSWSPKFAENFIVACGTVKLKTESNVVPAQQKLELFDLSLSQPSELLSISVPSR